jgi:hypothetical protein
MNRNLETVIKDIESTFQGQIAEGARNYLEVDIGEAGKRLGYDDLARDYRRVYAVVPLKTHVRGMKVRIDGRTFVDYFQFDSGVAVPGYVARETGLPSKSYVAQDSMICNFSN